MSGLGADNVTKVISSPELREGSKGDKRPRERFRHKIEALEKRHGSTLGRMAKQSQAALAKLGRPMADGLGDAEKEVQWVRQDQPSEPCGVRA